MKILPWYLDLLRFQYIFKKDNRSNVTIHHFHFSYVLEIRCSLSLKASIDYAEKFKSLIYNEHIAFTNHSSLIKVYANLQIVILVISYLQLVQNPSIKNTVKANFAGETASSIELQFVPNYDTSTVFVKDIEIKAFNKKGMSDLNVPFFKNVFLCQWL